MNTNSDHTVSLILFFAIMLVVVVIGMAAARWRPAPTMHNLEEWGAGGQAFGTRVSWFLFGGVSYGAYSFTAVPAAVYGAGANGFFAVAFAALCAPMMFIIGPRLWSVAHRHGFLSSAEFVRSRYGSQAVGGTTAIIGIISLIPYIGVQLLALQAVMRVLGFDADWPLALALLLSAAVTYRSGLRASALLSIVKAVLLVWFVIVALVVVGMWGGWDHVFSVTDPHYSAPDALFPVLTAGEQINYLSIILGSAFAMSVYPHTLNVILAAKDRSTLRKLSAASTVYCLALAVAALFGAFAAAQRLIPLGADLRLGKLGDLNTIVPLAIDQNMPGWGAGIALASLAVAALVPATMMSVSAGSLFARSVYSPFVRGTSAARRETTAARWFALAVQLMAGICLLLAGPSLTMDLQVFGGIIVLQTAPAILCGIYTGWPHRWAIMTGMVGGLAVSVALAYQVPAVGYGRLPDAREHFGGGSWSLSNIGLDSSISVYIGLVALVVNVLLTAVLTVLIRWRGGSQQESVINDNDFEVDASSPAIQRLDELLDGHAGDDPAPQHRHRMLDGPARRR